MTRTHEDFLLTLPTPLTDIQPHRSCMNGLLFQSFKARGTIVLSKKSQELRSRERAARRSEKKTFKEDSKNRRTAPGAVGLLLYFAAPKDQSRRLGLVAEAQSELVLAERRLSAARCQSPKNPGGERPQSPSLR